MGKVRQLTSGDIIPSNIDAERTVFGAVLLDNDSFFTEGMADLEPADFHLDSHQHIYSAINDIMFGLVEGARNVDIVTLSNELSRRKRIESIGGVAYLASLTEGLPLRPVVTEYVSIIKDKARLRRLMGVFKAGLVQVADQTVTASEVLGEVENELFKIEADRKTEAVPISEIVPTVRTELLAKRNINLDKTALELTWGLDPMDQKSKGIFGGELTIIAADSSGGKTSLLVQTILENALRGIPGFIASIEMKKEQIVQRMYPLLSGIITADHIRDPRLMNVHTHVPELERLSSLIAKLPIEIDDTSPLTIQQLRARVKLQRRRRHIKIAGVDYLQLLECPGAYGADETKKVVFGLRDLAKSEPDMALIALSQFSKEQGFMKKRRRTKSDLYGGSVIHHAAQNIVIITMEDSDKRAEDDDLDVELMIDKQRGGRKGKVLCAYDRKKLKFVPRGEGNGQSAIYYGKDRAAGS